MRTKSIAKILCLISFIIASSAVLVRPAEAGTPSWIAQGNYYQYQEQLFNVVPAGGIDRFTYNATVLSVTSTTAKYAEVYTGYSGASQKAQIRVNSTFDINSRKTTNAALGAYYSWLWILSSDVAAGKARLADKDFTLKATTSTDYQFDWTEPSTGNYSSLKYSISSLRLSGGSGTFIGGGERWTFALSSVGQGHVVLPAGSTTVLPSGAGTPRPLADICCRYSFLPPYHDGWYAAWDYNKEGCYTSDYNAGYRLSDGYHFVLSGATACPPYGKVFSYAQAGFHGPKAGSWVATRTENLLTRFWYSFSYVWAFAAATCSWFGCGASSTRAFVYASIQDVTDNYRTIASTTWVMWDCQGCSINWSPFTYNVDFPATLISPHSYMFTMHLDSDTRAAVIGGAFAWTRAQIQVTSQSVIFLYH